MQEAPEGSLLESSCILLFSELARLLADFWGRRLPDVGRLLAEMVFGGWCSPGGGDRFRKYRPVGRGIRLAGPAFLAMESCSKDIISINPHLPNGLSHHYHLDESTFNFRGIRNIFLFLFHFFFL